MCPGVLIHDMLDAVQSCMHPEVPLAVRYEVHGIMLTMPYSVCRRWIA